MGAGVFAELLSKTKPETLDAVVISHFHGDHCSDITVFNYYLQQKKKKLKLFAPVDNNTELLSSLEWFEHIETKDSSRVTIKGVTLDFFKTVHPRFCLGVSVTYNGKKFVYSADTNVCPALDKALKGADLAVIDSAFSSATYKENGPHLSAELVAGYAKRHNVKTLLSHLPPEGDVGVIEKEAKNVSSLCELIDLREYVIAD